MSDLNMSVLERREEDDTPLKIGAIFMVMAASLFGAGFPVVAKKVKWLKVPDRVFFACKHFGTGVLVATAFVHLLPVAFGSLTDPSLPEFFIDIYPALPGAIMMGSMFILFVIEMYLNAKTGGHSHGGPTGTNHSHGHDHHHGPPRPRRASIGSEFAVQKEYERQMAPQMAPNKVYEEEMKMEQNFLRVSDVADAPMPAWFVVFYEQYVRERIDMMRQLRSTTYAASESSYDPKQDLAVESNEMWDQEGQKIDPQVLRKMNLNISLLEGGILFHSIFVGITISITTDGFVILLVAIMFHQMFEGVGLGSRIADVPYPRGSIRPWVLVAAFGTTAPIGQAIGLATRGSYDPESAYGLIIVGVFNAMSSGLLLYAALVDLLAEDFLSEEANRILTKAMRIEAFFWVLLGAIGMSIIGAFA